MKAPADTREQRQGLGNARFSKHVPGPEAYMALISALLNTAAYSAASPDGALAPSPPVAAATACASLAAAACTGTSNHAARLPSAPARRHPYQLMLDAGVHRHKQDMQKDTSSGDKQLEIPNYGHHRPCLAAPQNLKQWFQFMLQFSQAVLE